MSDPDQYESTTAPTFSAQEQSDRSSVINTSSIQAYEPSGHLLGYAATKAAINSLTVNLAQQLGSQASGSTRSRRA